MSDTQTFNESGVGVISNNIFGLPFTKKDARIVVLPVPWDVTVSYRDGSAKGPQAVFDASFQVDLFDEEIKDAWTSGIYMEPIPSVVRQQNSSLRKKALHCIKYLERGGSPSSPVIKNMRDDVNKGSKFLNKFVEDKAAQVLADNKMVALLGGDHSCPLGLFKALSFHYPEFGILHIDAHADLRTEYEGFEFSHASIMNNALKIKEVVKLVQVGVRDFCREEADLIKNSRGRVVLFTDRQLQREKYKGKTWNRICAGIVKTLPKNVHISFDIDGLEPNLCPNTGTPVPSGLKYEEVFALFEIIISSGRKIIGFDLCEVSPGTVGDIDAVIGARILYRLANLMNKSQNK